MSFNLNHFPLPEALNGIVRTFFEMTYSADNERSDYLLPSGRVVFFHIKTENEFLVEFENSENFSKVSTGYYLAYLDGTAKYVHQRINVVVASIYPIYSGLIFGIKPRDILNTFTRLEDLVDIRECGLPLGVDDLNNNQLVECMQRFILSRLNNNPLRTDIETLYNKVVRTKAYGITVAELSEWAGYSERHITNIFQEHIGLSPKRFIQLIRFNESIKMVDDLERFPKLSDVAYEMGYHDQAHFTRDFKRFCGKTPKQIRLERDSAAYLFRKGRVD